MDVLVSMSEFIGKTESVFDAKGVLCISKINLKSVCTSLR